MHTRKWSESEVVTLACLVILLAWAGISWGAYIDNGDGTVTDTATGLIWQQADDLQPRNWQEALSYCEALDLALKTDWRLPDIRELRSILDHGRYNPAIDPAFGCQSTWYWSGSTDAYRPSYAWYVWFHSGGSYFDSKTGIGLVRCVRVRFIQPCVGDFEPDGDIDGSDLYGFIAGNLALSIEKFADSFGKSDCS